METILSYLGILGIGFVAGFFTYRHFFKAKVTINISELKNTGNKPIFECVGNVEVLINSNHIKNGE